MNIKINQIKNKKEYIDEALYVAQFKEKIVNNPNKKIIPLTKDLKIRGILIAIITISIALTCFPNFRGMNTNNLTSYIILNTIATAFTVFALICFIIILIRYKKVNKIIKETSQKDSNSELYIDDKIIRLINHNTGLTIENKWENIDLVLFSKYSISFIDSNRMNPVISIPINCKEECIKILENYSIDIPVFEEKER